MIIKKDSYINDILRDCHYTPTFEIDFEFKDSNFLSIDFSKDIDIFVMASTTLESVDKVKLSEKDLSVFRNLNTSCFILNKVTDDEYVSHVEIKVDKELETIDFVITVFSRKKNCDEYMNERKQIGITGFDMSKSIEDNLLTGLFDNRRFSLKYSLKENKIIDSSLEEMCGNTDENLNDFFDLEITPHDLRVSYKEVYNIDLDDDDDILFHNTFDYRSIFKSLVYIYFTDKEDIHIDLPANKKIRANNLRIKNDTNLNITYIDSMWNKIMHVNGVKVKGHLALRACGKGRKDRRITWIKPHNKTYTRKREIKSILD